MPNKGNMSYTSLEAAWGPDPGVAANSYPALPAPSMAAGPQKVYAGGNGPQKVYAGGNAPEKVFEQPADMPANPEHERLIKAVLMEQQRHAMRIEQLMHYMANKPVEGKGMTVMDVILIVLALVFIVLVLFLISCVRSLRSRL